MKIDFFADVVGKPAARIHEAFVQFAAPVASRANGDIPGLLIGSNGIPQPIGLNEYPSALEKNALRDFSYLLRQTGIEVFRTANSPWLPQITGTNLEKQPAAEKWRAAAQFLYNNLAHCLQTSPPWFGSPVTYNTMTFGAMDEWHELKQVLTNMGVDTGLKKSQLPATRLGVYSYSRVFNFGDTEVEACLPPDFQKLDDFSLKAGRYHAASIAMAQLNDAARRGLPLNSARQSWDFHIAQNNSSLLDGELSRRQQKAQYHF